jgi:hypothetical protein
MKEPGYIYVLVNPSMEGFVKVGKTTRDPEARAKELSQATGVATPFYVALAIQVADCHSAEDYVYSVLEYNGFVRTPNREFFKMPLRKAIEVLLLVEKHLQDEAPAVQPVANAADQFGVEAKLDEQHPGFPIFTEAIATFYGYDDTIQDETEAVRLLFKAKSLNFPAAYTDLAQYYCQWAPYNTDGGITDEAVIEGERQALEILKEGASKGHGRCFIKMANIFHSQSSYPPPFRGQADCLRNAHKCWKKYFFSETFANDDDQRWTVNIEHSLGVVEARGWPRAVHAGMYLFSLWKKHLQADEDIKNQLLPLREAILQDINQRLNYYQDQLSQSNSSNDSLADVGHPEKIRIFLPKSSKEALAHVEQQQELLRFAQGYF